MAQQPELSFRNQRKFLFSVVVATRNRAAVLADLLRGLHDQIRAAPDVELVIVDNESTDNTRGLVQQFIQSCTIPGRVRYFRENRIGLSAARNVGVRLAQGSYIIFIDDDVDPEPHWLNGYCKVIEYAPNLRAAGGRVEPRPEPGADLSFIGQRYLWVYGRLDYGRRTRLLSSRETFNGCNMLFEKSTFLRLGGFDESLGHKGEALGGCEEQELLTRIRQRYPKSCYYAGEAKVYHRIPASRATVEYAVARIRVASQAFARSEARHRPRLVVALKSVYYFVLILIFRVFPVGQFRYAECIGYLEGLLKPSVVDMNCGEVKVVSPTGQSG